MNVRCTPKPIVHAHPPDQRPQFRSDLRPASHASGFPAPVTAKSSAMTAHDGLRPQDYHGPENLDALLDGDGIDQEDQLPPIDDASTPVTRLGDLWHRGEHRVFCGEALQAESYARVLGTDKAEMSFADPPYNVAIGGHVSGVGAVNHGDFAMASGELSPAEFGSFLKASHGHAA